MKFTHSVPLISLAAAAAEAGTLPPPPPEHIFANPPTTSSSGHRIPTSYESAVMGRRILALTPLGNLATVFPAASEHEHEHEHGHGQYGAAENRPDGLGGMPHAMMEYVADCEGDGNPTFLAINVETTFKNVRDGSNISLAQQWTPPYPPDKRIRSARRTTTTTNTGVAGLLSRAMSWFGFGPAIDEEGDGDDDGGDSEPRDTVPYSAANLPRFSLLGYIEKISEEDEATTTTTTKTTSAAALSECFVKQHPDAKYWLPGSRVHKSDFVRLRVQQVYWVGGFGDRAYIGWIPVDEWTRVSRAEWEGIRLPGEKKGWEEWPIGTVGDL